MYGLFVFGWCGDVGYWVCYEWLSLVLVGLLVLLVFLVYSMVVLDFFEGLLLGWYFILFLLFFIVGVLFFGFVMVLVLGILLCCWYYLEVYIIECYLDNLVWLMFVVGLVVGYSYVIELFIVFYSMDCFEIVEVKDCLFGVYVWMFWLIVGCNVVLI